MCISYSNLKSIIIDKYPAGVYISIEHVQLLTVLPIAGSYFTNVVNGLFRLTRFALLGFDVTKYISKLHKLIETIYYNTLLISTKI